MRVLEAIKGLLGGDGIDGVLESTGVAENLEGLVGDGSALADTVGVDLGQLTETLGVDGVTESLPGGLGDALDGVREGGPEVPSP